MIRRQTQVVGMAVAGALAMAASASATVLHQWEFDDASGTALGDAVDSAGGSSWLGGVADTEMATDGAGNLAFGSTTNTVDAFLLLSATTNGSLFVRIDYTDWDVGAVAGDEQISYYFEGVGNVRMELLRWAAGTWDLTAWSQSNHLASVKTYGSAESTVSTVLEVNLDALQYRVWWGDGSVSGWSTSPWAPAWSGLSVSSLRFRKAGDFSQAGDIVNIDAITVANQLADVIGLPPYPQNLVAGWLDDSGVAAAPGVGISLDVVSGGASFDPDYNCSDRYYGPDGNPAYSTGPDDVNVSAVTFQSNQYALVTLTNVSADTITLDELRFDWGARFNGSPRFFYLTYEAGDLAGVTPGALLWSITDFGASPPATNNVDDYNDADIDLTALADNTLDAGEFATFRLEVDQFGDPGKSIWDNIGFFGDVPKVPPLITNLVQTTVPSPVDVILLDLDSTIFRGLPVVNPDQNGNYWNVNLVGVFATQLVNCANIPTDVDFGFSTPVAFDSYNGPAGPTSSGTLTSDVLNTDIDVAALGKLGVTNAAFDYVTNPVNFPVTENVRFEIQGLDSNLLYDLTFYSSHKYNDFPTNEDNTTVFAVYSDSDYNTVVDSAVVTHGVGASHNRDTLVTITGLSPQTTNNFLYVDFRGGLGGKGYLNAMQIVSTTPAEAAVIEWEGAIGSTYDVEEATDIVGSNWTGVVTGLVGSGSSMSATVVLDSVSAAIRVNEIIPPPLVALFSDDFESGLNGWTTGFVGAATTKWELGAPSNVGPAGANSGTNCWGTNIDSGYFVSAECWLRSPEIDLTSVGTAFLSWQHALDIEDPFDWGVVNILDTNNVALISELGGKITGEDLAPAWSGETRSLDGAVGNVIKIEFRFKSDSFDLRSFAGWYIDDVEVSAP